MGEYVVTNLTITFGGCVLDCVLLGRNQSFGVIFRPQRGRGAVLVRFYVLTLSCVLTDMLQKTSRSVSFAKVHLARRHHPY